MGAEFFITDPYAGQSADAAFAAAQDDALFWHGHGPYSGTISEKDDFALVRREAATVQGAIDLAHDALRDDDVRYVDKHGPAGAIPVVTPTRTVMVTVDKIVVPTGRFGADSGALREAALSEVRRKRLIRRGEKVQAAEKQQYSADPTGRWVNKVTLRDVTMQVTLSKPKSRLTRAAVAETVPDAWVFFGFAAS